MIFLHEHVKLSINQVVQVALQFFAQMYVSNSNRKNVMKMKTIAASLLATLSLASASAMAASYDVTISGTPVIYTNTNLLSNVSFAGFNTALGTLTGVSIKLNADVDGKVYVLNDSNVLKNGYVALDVLLGFGTGSSASTFYTGQLYNQNYSLAAGDDITLGQHGLVSASTSFSSGLDYFKTASVSGLTGVNAVSHTTGGEDVVTAFTTKVLATGTVTYTYTAAPVPEPETYGMLLVGLGLMGVVARRKRASAQA